MNYDLWSDLTDNWFVTTPFILLMLLLGFVVWREVKHPCIRDHKEVQYVMVCTLSGKNGCEMWINSPAMVSVCDERRP